MFIASAEEKILRLYSGLRCLFIFNKQERRKKRFQLQLHYGLLDQNSLKHTCASVLSKYNGLISNGKNIEQLILGSSRSCMGILPFMMGETTYNYANHAFGLYETYCQLQDAIRLCPNLKRVIVDVAFYSGGWWVVRTRDVTLCRILANKLGYHYDFPDWEDADFRRFDKMIENYGAGEQPICQGFEFLFGKYTGGGIKVSHFTDKHTHLAKSYTNQWVHLEHICQLCQEKGIELVIVTTPVVSLYQKQVDDLCAGENYLKPAYDIAQSYGAKWFDITDGFDDKTDFYNCYHLNFNGAVKYTRRLMGLLEESKAS